MGCGNSVVTAADSNDPTDNVNQGKTKPLAHADSGSPNKDDHVWTIEEVYRESNLSSKQTIDEQMALDQVNGDIELLQDLNGMMGDQFKQDFGDIRRCHNDRNWFKMWKAAHSLKGATANLGINKFAEVCKLLEHMGKEMEAMTTAGQPISKSKVQKAEIYIELLAREWEEYRKCYDAFERRLLDQQK